ncbi:MAG: class I SAM-dependent methyltransferase [Deltaproteobacteria bacterium]|nr:class I SAM-dependent methyltransferase [Deltaproteobacteria bacterium]
MTEEDHRLLYELEEGYWWFIGMRAITAALLDPHCAPAGSLDLLDAGCGTGIMLSWLTRYSRVKPVVGIDFSRHGLRFCRQRGHSLLALASVTGLPFATNRFDLITCFDVLCQLPTTDASDIEALHELHRILKPQGLLYLRVPAYKWLRSSHDTALHTYHRYTLREIVTKLQRVGFTVERATYANTLPFLLALVRRLLKKAGIGRAGSDVTPFPAWLRWLNGVLLSLLLREARYLSRHGTRFSFGLSAICLARKPGAPG